MKVAGKREIVHLLFKGFPLAGILFLIFINLFFNLYTEAFFSFVSDSSGINQEVLKSKVFTQERIGNLKIFLFVLLILTVLLYFLITRHKQYLLSLANDCKKEAIIYFRDIFQDIKNLLWWERGLISVCLLLFFLYVCRIANNYPLHVDEAFSWVYFVRNGVGVISSYYPGPNNHILYLHLCNLVSVFTTEPELVMRIPVLLCSLIFITGFFLWIKKKFGFVPSICATIFIAGTSALQLYSAHGRGYILILLCTLLLINSADKVFDSVFYKILFIVAGVAGFYAVPVFLYPYAAIAVWQVSLSGKNKKQLLFLVKLHAIVALVTIFAYSPILMLNGFGALFSNDWVQSMSMKTFLTNLPDWIKGLQEFFWHNYHVFGFVIVALTVSILMMLWKRAYSKELKMVLCFAVVIPFVLLIQRVLPFPRTMIFILLPAGLLMGYLAHALGKIKKWLVIFPLLISAFVALEGIGEHERKIHAGFPFYEKLHVTIPGVLESKPKNVLVYDDIYHVFFKYWAIKLKNEVTVDFVPDKEQYDFIILPSGMALPPKFSNKIYTLVDSGPYVSVYLHN